MSAAGTGTAGGSSDAFKVRRIVGVDFSGAKAAGRNIWLAEVELPEAALHEAADRRQAVDTIEEIDAVEMIDAIEGIDAIGAIDAIDAIFDCDATEESRPATLRAATPRTGAPRPASPRPRAPRPTAPRPTALRPTALRPRGASAGERRTMSDRAAARPVLISLDRLETLAGTPDREPALAWLVDRIAQSVDTLWAIDFPFALPIEMVDASAGLDDQLRAVAAFDGQAHAFGVACCDTARTLGGKLHLRRETDVLTRTPFDGYHYRIIYQTFHGMRDVLLPLRHRPGTCVAPFDPLDRDTRRVVVEACPGSTLKRWHAPHQNYKQPAGGPLTALRRNTRRAIVAHLADHLTITPGQVRVMMRNPGGDALDAALAAAGAADRWPELDPAALHAHRRYGREGFIVA